MQGNKNRSKSNLRSIQAEILNGYMMSSLGKAKLDLPIADFFPLLSWLFTATRKGKVVAKKLKDTLYPRSVASLQSGPILPLASLDRELYWFQALIITNYQRLNRFLELERIFENALTKELGEQCFEILDNVELEFGQSIWLIENRIASLQYFEGVESQKNMCQS